jgi:hypothetical protein
MEMKNWFDIWQEANESRININVNKLCSFGIKPLDDAIIGFLPNDLVVIGADSGVGKSELCLNMALYNAKCGKRVALYFIEGGAEEAIYRIQWQVIKQKYYEKGCTGVTIDYRKWRMGLLNNSIIKDIEKECLYELYNLCGDRLQIYSFEEGFTITHLINSLGYFSKQKIEHGVFVNDGYNVDLIIIDHLQYFSLTNEKSENQEMSDILMKVKDITNFHKIPIVLVSHLRKKEKDRGLPGQEDFHGTSNICKLASIAITISAISEKENYSKEIYPTAFRFVKSRTGIRGSYAIVCNFDYKKQKYQQEYKIYKMKGNFPLAEPILDDDLPRWATKQNTLERKDIQTYV